MMPTAVPLCSSLPLLWLLLLSWVIFSASPASLCLHPFPGALERARCGPRTLSRDLAGRSPNNSPKRENWAVDHLSNKLSCNINISSEIAEYGSGGLQLCSSGLQIITRLPYSSRKKETLSRMSGTKSGGSSSEIWSQAVGKAWMLARSSQWIDDRRYFLFRYELR